MKTEAEAHAEEDRKRKELVEVKNTADNTVYTAEKMLRDGGDKVSADLKKEVEDAIAKVRTALTEENADSIRSTTEALNQSIQKVGAAMYSQTGGPAADGSQTGGEAAPEQGGGGSTPGGDNGDVVDGEFKSA